MSINKHDDDDNMICKVRYMYCKVIVVVLDKDSVLITAQQRQHLKKIDNASNNGISIADDNDDRQR